jgi:hypothetical protein
MKEMMELSLQIEIIFKRCSSYSEGYKEIKEHVNKLCVEKIHVSDTLVKSRLIATYNNWKNEKPPLGWYCLCLSYYFYCDDLPVDVLIMLMRASNYYGNYEHVEEIYNSESVEKLDIKRRSEYLKQVAKAFKNMGMFVESQRVYREILGITSGKYRNTYHTYYLMLYAKLCNDYQQRQAFYIALHKISYDRIKKYNDEKRVSGIPKVWEYISKDSYAKSIFNEDSVLSMILYGDLLSLGDIKIDSLVRIKAHYYELKIISLISKGKDEYEYGKVLQYYADFKEIFNDLRESDNVRANNVRQIQYLRITRLIINYLGGIKDLKLPAGIDDLLNGEAMSLANYVYASSKFFNDWKTCVYAKVEMSFWGDMCGESGGEYLIAERIVHLENAKVILAEKYKAHLSGIYYDVLFGLAENYIKIRDWANASNAYKEIYEYSKNLIKVVEHDEQMVDMVINIKYDDRDKNKCIDPEFWTLNNREINEIKKRLSVDYKYLLDRMIFVSDRLYSLGMAQAANTAQKTMELSRSFKYHSLSERLRKLLIDTVNNPEVYGKIMAFDDDLKKWKNEEINMFEIRDIDVKKELIRAIDEYLTVDADRIKICGVEDGKIRFNEFVLRKILDGLILNTVESARRNKVIEYTVQVGAFITEKICYLWVGDNTGDCESLSKSVELINSNQDINVIKARAKGLYLIKEMIGQLTSNNNKLYVEEYGEKYKRICVPLGVIY